MPSDHDSDSLSHLPRADDEVRAKKDLWAAAKEAAQARRQPQPAAVPEPAQPPPPRLKRRIKIRKPLPATAVEVQEEPTSFETAPQEQDELPDDFAAVEEQPSPPESDEPAPAPPSDAIPAKDELAPQPPRAPASGSEPDKPTPKGESESLSAPPGPIIPHLEDMPLSPQEKFRRTWENIGGRYLTMSVLIHLGIILFAGLVYFTYTNDERIDFMPGGGTQQGEAASQSLENQVTRKKSRWLQKVPMQRVAVEKSMSAISLPDAMPDLLDIPVASDIMDAGKLGSLGFGKAGAGGGFGNGIGIGGKSGVTFTPLSMFGKKIVGRRILVVLDVSRSMTSYLEAVVKELDRVAPGSPVILYCGCGLKKPEEVVMERVGRTQHQHFEVYWRIWQGEIIMTSSEKVDPDRVKFDRKIPVSQPDVFRFFARRNQTYFVYDHTLDYTWIALLSEQARNADALYWFSDFQDPVDAYQLKTVLDNLLVRRQRLYIHPQEHGSYFKDVVEQLVVPSGGDVIEPDEGKKGKR